MMEGKPIKIFLMFTLIFQFFFWKSQSPLWDGCGPLWCNSLIAGCLRTKNISTPQGGRLQLSSIAHECEGSSVLPVHPQAITASSQKTDTARRTYTATSHFLKHSLPQTHCELTFANEKPNCWKEQQSKNCHRWEDSFSALWRWRNKPGQTRAHHPDLLSTFIHSPPTREGTKEQAG